VGPVAAPMAPEVDAGGADEELTTVQRSRLLNRLLVDQEAIEEREGLDTLVHLPRWCLRPSHLASPRASTPGVSSFAGASNSRAAPVGGPSPSIAGWDDLEWGCLLDPAWQASRACILAFSLSGLAKSRCFFDFMQQGPLPRTFNKEGPGRRLGAL
jgi:hypothetical protein